MAFAAGAATFNSCNKAGSIVQFTDHLRMHPNDYNALMWRAKAYSIVGEPQNAFRDFETAISVSSGVKREIATGYKIRMTSTSADEFGAHVKRSVERYPYAWTAWAELARYHADINDVEEANRCNMKSLELAARFQETRDPGICWINREVGHYFLAKGNTDTAKTFFDAAIESCPTHTVSHIGLFFCNIGQGNLQSARQNFERAKTLNPNLASQVFKTDDFAAYLSSLLDQQRQQSGSRAMGGAGAGTGGGSRGGEGGGGGGSGSDDDDPGDVSSIWKRLQKEAPSIKMYKGHKYAQSKCGNYWYSRDTARHGGAQFKRYEDTGRTLRFKDSLDEKLSPMTSKHESREGTIIRKSDMNGVR